MGFGDIGGGVTFDLMERDLFGGNAGGRLELFLASTTMDAAAVVERLELSCRAVTACATKEHDWVVLSDISCCCHSACIELYAATE